MLKDYRGQSKAGCPLDAQDLFHQTVPNFGRLLKAIQGSVELADHVRVSRVHKADRLSSIHCLHQSVVKEGILDIELMHWPGP
jgi:hypothetical protein